MSDRHLCKAKRTDNGEWAEGFYLPIGDKTYIICSAETESMDGENTDLYATEWYEVDPSTICQCTGIEDTDGRKIFEWDICEFSVFDYNGHDTQYKGVVVYCGSRFMLWKSKDSEYYGNDGGFDLDWTVGQDDEFDIIGNIFDNPELLEGGAE